MTRSTRPITAILTGVGVFLLGFNLRAAITSVGPVLPDIGETFGLEASRLGLLGALPLLMFALISAVASFLTRHVGVDRLAFFALIVIAIGITMRSTLGLPGLWIGTVLATAAIAVGNVLGTVLVRRDFPRHAALATGILTAVMGIGASVASATSAPLAEAWGWQRGLWLWAIPPLIIAVIWLPRVRSSTPMVRTALNPVVTSTGLPSPARVPVWRKGSSWWLMAFMGVQSSGFYFLITWLPTLSIMRGSTAAEGGIHLFWYQIAGLASGFLVPLLMRGREYPRLALLVASTPVAIGFAGILFFGQFVMLWSIVLGVGAGMSIVTALTLVAQRGRTHGEIARLSGMVQAGGYLLAALTPFVAGVLIESFGTDVWALRLMSVMAVGQVLIGLMVSRTPTRVPLENE